MREVAPTDEREAAVDDHDLAMVALFEIRHRREPRHGARDAELDAGPRGEAGQDGVLGSEGAVHAVQRVDEHAHRHAARAGVAERGLDGPADLVVERHVDLHVDALYAARDPVEQPGARLGVVELDLDPVARDRRGGRLGHGLGLVEPAMEQVRDGETGGAHAGGHAPQPHRIVRLGHVVRVAFVENRARVDDTRRKACRLEALPDDRCATGRTKPNRERLGNVGAREGAQRSQHLVGQIGIEEHERLRSGTDHGEPTALESAMNAAGPRSLTHGNRPAGTSTASSGRSLSRNGAK